MPHSKFKARHKSYPVFKLQVNEEMCQYYGRPGWDGMNLVDLNLMPHKNDFACCFAQTVELPKTVTL